MIGTPFFVVFGALSDRIGRKPIVLAGCVLAALTYFPVFKALTHFANPALEHAVETAPISVVARPEDCSFQFDPVGKKSFATACDIAKSALATAGVPLLECRHARPRAARDVGDRPRHQRDRRSLVRRHRAVEGRAENADRCLPREAEGSPRPLRGYPPKADPAQVNRPMVILVCTYLVLLVTMVYGPIAAWLVEMFPTRIRYTSMSLPYHIGNGWFGGFLPVTSFAIVAATGDIYRGLWYPVAVAALTAVIGALFLKDTRTLRRTSQPRAEVA